MQRKRKVFRTLKEVSKIKADELFTREGNLKRIDPKTAVSIARQLADGFDNYNLHNTPPKNAEKKARLIIREFFASSTQGKYKLIRPRKSHRKLYAEFADVPKSFKIYPMPVINDDDTFSVKKKRGQLIIQRLGEYYVSEFYPFKNQLSLVTNPSRATKAVWKQIKEGHRKKFVVRIKCGRGEFAAHYDNEIDPAETIAGWIKDYGKTRVKKFCAGLQVYTFKEGHEDKPIKKLIKKKHKPRPPKRRLL